MKLYNEMAEKKLSTSWSFEKIVVLIVASFTLMNPCIASPLGGQSQVCKTPECMEAAQLVLKNMDGTIDPCDDFYKFACGKFTKETVIPDDQSSVSLFSKTVNQLQDQLKATIEGKLDESDPEAFKLLQSYYNVCLDTEKIETTGIEELNSILNSLGNWPVLVGKLWSESKFNWQTLVYQLRKLGYTGAMDSILGIGIEIDEKNTGRYIITLDQAATGIPQEYLSKGMENKVVQAYYKYMVELAKVLGANSKDAGKELTESLNFEIGLAKISLASEDRRNMSQLYNVKTVRQLHAEYPYIPWDEYLTQLVSPHAQINLTNEVIVRVPRFLESLSQLLSKTPKRTLANYMIWRVVKESAGFMNEQARKVQAEFSASLSGTIVQKPRWAQCIGYVSGNLPLAVGALYVRKNFDKNSKADVEKLMEILRESFENMLKQIEWMDDETKIAAQKKLNAITTHAAYPDEFFDNEKLDKHFENLQVDVNSFLKSHLSSNLFNMGNILKQFDKTVDKTGWLTGLHGMVAMVNAFYAPTENSVQIPAGILQGHFFSSKRPNYMNYGAIAFIIGHEFTHGFDDQGGQYDKDGNLANWWDDNTKQEYLERAQCIIDQYSNYTVKEVELNINGKNTQGENIADNGGVKEAYLAYEKFEKQNGEEPRLPGLPYSPRQMFWISAANIWCEKLRPEALKNRVITDVHSTGEFRVIGPFSNMPQFSKDFNCPQGSYMNPVKKCTVW